MDSDDIIMTIENIPSHNIVYMRRTGPYGIENSLLMEEFKKWAASHDLFNDKSVILGIAMDDNRTTSPEACRYDVCLIVPDDFDILDGKVMKRILDGGKYVIIQIPHTAEAVQEAWASTIPSLADNGYTFDLSRQILERYPKKMVDVHRCEICVPILSE